MCIFLGSLSLTVDGLMIIMNLKWSTELWGKLPRVGLEMDILTGEPNLLTWSIVGGWGPMAVCDPSVLLGGPE